MAKRFTLCIVHDAGQVLLGMKKRGFGAGKWNGFGGKLLPGETVEDAARRELREEAGIEALALEKRGALTFVFEGDPMPLEVHVFSVPRWRGEPTESEEMLPRWFPHAEIPFDAMWADDRHWLPLLLAGRRFRGDFLFRGDALVHHTVKTELS